jgi:hypothetical protein
MAFAQVNQIGYRPLNEPRSGSSLVFRPLPGNPYWGVRRQANAPLYLIVAVRLRGAIKARHACGDKSACDVCSHADRACA